MFWQQLINIQLHTFTINENIARGHFLTHTVRWGKKTAPFCFCNSFVKTSSVTTFLVDIYVNRFPRKTQKNANYITDLAWPVLQGGSKLTDGSLSCVVRTVPNLGRTHHHSLTSLLLDFRQSIFETGASQATGVEIGGEISQFLLQYNLKDARIYIERRFLRTF